MIDIYDRAVDLWDQVGIRRWGNRRCLVSTLTRGARLWAGAGGGDARQAGLAGAAVQLAERRPQAEGQALRLPVL
jgi:hypothetical protein